MKGKTVVKGIRASQEFFDKCDLVAEAEGIDRNKLIIRVVSEYCGNAVENVKSVIIDGNKIKLYSSMPYDKEPIRSKDKNGGN